MAVAWDELLNVLGGLQSFDPTRPDVEVAPYLVALRVRGMRLVDYVPWPGFDRWVAKEQLRVVLLMREAMERGYEERERMERYLEPAEALEIDREFHQSVAAYTSNLRFARKGEPEAGTFDGLTTLAQRHIEGVCKRRHWDLPPEKLEGLELFDLSAFMADGNERPTA